MSKGGEVVSESTPCRVGELMAMVKMASEREEEQRRVLMLKNGEIEVGGG